MIISLIFPILGFILQAYPRIIKKSFGVDVWTRLLEIDLLRKNKNKIPSNELSGQFLIPGFFDYPPVFPWIMSHFSKKRLESLEGYVSPFFDSLQTLLVFWVCFFLTQNLFMSLLAQLIYILTPMIAIENSYLTPRSLGYLSFSLAALSVLGFYSLHGLGLLLLSILFSLGVFLTHRFATQSYFFITIFFSFYFKSLTFPIVFLIGIILAVALTKGYYLRVLKGHFFNVYFWIKNLDFRFAHQVRGLQKTSKNNDWVEKIYEFLQVFSPIAMFGLNPWAALSLLGVFLHVSKVIFLPEYIFFFSCWVVFFYLFGAIILKVKQLMPIGEGQRYMEMATVPSSVVAAYLIFKLYSQLPFWIFLSSIVAMFGYSFFSIIFVQLQGVVKDKNRSISDSLRNLFTYVNNQKKKFRIVCIPHQNTTMLIYHTKASVLVNVDNPGLMKLDGVFPILRMSLPDLKKKFNLTHVLIRTSFVGLSELGLKNSEIEFKDGDVILVRL